MSFPTLAVAGGELEAVSVKLFVGRASGKPVVSLQVYTLEGKLANASEYLRRAWEQADGSVRFSGCG